MPETRTPCAASSQRARLASLTAKNGPDHPETRAARREYRRARAEMVIRDIVDQAPELTDADREHLAALLRPTAPVTTAGAA